jgi:hypothetical protein
VCLQFFFPLDAFLGRLKSVGKGNVLQLDESVKEVNHVRFTCSVQNVIWVRGYMRFEFVLLPDLGVHVYTI